MQHLHYMLNTDNCKQAARSGSPQLGTDAKPAFSKSTSILTGRHSLPVVNALPSNFHFSHPVHFLGAAAAAARLPEMKPENLSLDQRARHAAEAMACLAAAPVAMTSQASITLDGGLASVLSTALSQAGPPTVDESAPTNSTTSATNSQPSVLTETTSAQSQMDKYSGYDRHFKKKFFGSERRARCDSAQKDERTPSESTVGTSSEDPRETTPTASPDPSGWENPKAGALRPSSRNECQVSPAMVGSSNTSSSLGGPMAFADSLKASLAKHAVTGPSAARPQNEGSAISATSRSVNRASPAVCSSPLPVDAAHLSGGFCLPPSYSTPGDADRRGHRLTPVVNCLMPSELRDRIESSISAESERSLPRRSSGTDLSVGARCDDSNVSDDNR
jgi:hypothetical protein